VIAFKGPKRQGGWIVLGSVVVGALGSVSQQASQNKQNKVKYQDESDLSNLNFQQQDWLAQQQHKWDLQAYQQNENYKQGAIAGFEKYAPANVADASGKWQAPPKPVDMSGQEAGLAPVGSNGLPVIIDPRTGQPMDQNYNPAPAGTLQQVA
jgi:hypothetical protein